MMKTLREFRTNVRSLTGDDGGRRYSDDMVDMGLREALGSMSMHLPNRKKIPARVTGRKPGEAMIGFVPAPGMEILSFTQENGRQIRESVYSDDGSKTLLQFRENGRTPVLGEILTLEVSVPYTIRGLDNAQRTDVPDNLALTLAKGAAAYAMRSRANAVTEVFGKRPEDSANILRQSQLLFDEFYAELRAAGQKAALKQPPWPAQGFPI